MTGRHVFTVDLLQQHAAKNHRIIAGIGPWSDVMPLKFGRSWRTQEEFQTPTTEMTPMELGQVWGGKPPT
ncbi:hypothetical protein Tsubulata_014499 [Turnera subulata]|uniref:Uncharacterized protein n=1 Tax=Turnera subulata TaxID=218843 RepID=A0A9Q0GJZ8_9ROSI|nr:hypothetical protein Tsubulata_014499 [Turnera subulata]